jgi:hypothetical protein
VTPAGAVKVKVPLVLKVCDWLKLFGFKPKINDIIIIIDKNDRLTLVTAG